ncbi:MAG TPA: GAF domain-containing protein [Vicinamibacteria bacterium]|nr:GAF domain-containing protein [Vicinamibacteria bacterium]
MDIDRLLREIETRLASLPAPERESALFAIRQELAREGIGAAGSDAVDGERQRRLEAETLREVLEAINRQARLEDTIDEVLKQLTRIVPLDACSLALVDLKGRFRIIAGRGFEDPSIVGTTFRDPISDAILRSHWPLAIEDVREDARFEKIAGSENIRSWAGIPLLVEGEPIGLLCLDRYRVEAFTEEDLHLAKALAFSAAAAIRKAQLLEQVRRYAALMERVVEVDQAVFADLDPHAIARVILQGAVKLGNYPGGLFVLPGPGSPNVAVGLGPFAGLEGAAAPPEIDIRSAERLGQIQVAAVALALGVTVTPQDMYLVPLSTGHAHLATLALLDPNGETADDRLMEAYASRAAAAYLHALRLAG